MTSCDSVANHTFFSSGYLLFLENEQVENTMKTGLLQGCRVPADEIVEHAKGCHYLTFLQLNWLMILNINPFPISMGY